MVNKAKAIRNWIHSVGWRATLTWALYKGKKALGFEASSLKIKPLRASYPVTARLGGSSDLGVFDQIFMHNEYACLRSIQSPRLILDLGANVGYSSAYFLTCFPSAKVLAVEPDPGNYELCRMNLVPYGDRARVVMGAVWSTRSRLALSRGTFGDGREWATQVVAGGNGDVEGWDIPSLLELMEGKEIDILKVDIERSELDLFDSACSSWLPKVRNICIELHGPDCEKVFFHALRDFDYDLERSGELTVCRNMRQRQPSLSSALN